MSDELKRTVKRFDELVTDKQIDDIVQKYALGQEIWWNRQYANTKIPATNPLNGQNVTINIPTMSIHLGMRGFLVGPENYIWWHLELDAFPTLEKIDHYVMVAIESMRQNKARQFNGTGPGRSLK